MSSTRREVRRLFVDGRAQWGAVDGDVVILGSGQRVDPRMAVHLPPCEPTKIICVHLNYDERRVEMRLPTKTATASYFLKPPSSLNAHGGAVHRPRGHKYLNYEGEIGVVIGKPTRNVTREEAWDCVAGYVPANDIGTHDFRDIDHGSMARVKGMDTFCPVGPGLVSGIDIRQSTLRTYLNGTVVQEAKASDMEFGIDYLIADLSRHMTLLPGDLILSGTPANSRPMNIGDVVEVEVTGVGRLTNTIVEAPADTVRIGHQPTDTEAVRSVALGGDFFRGAAAE